MDQSIKAKLTAPPDPPVDAVRKFLQSYCSDYDSMDQIKGGIRGMMTVNTRTLHAGRAGLEALLSDPAVEPGVLARLVAVDANKGLHDPSDAGARHWLEDLLQVLQHEIQ